MATLSKNGAVIAELTIRAIKTDGADVDTMTFESRTIYRAMTSGWMLKRCDTKADHGTGSEPSWNCGKWKRAGKVKAVLMEKSRGAGNWKAVKDAMHTWQEQLIMKGLDAEITA